MKEISNKLQQGAQISNHKNNFSDFSTHTALNLKKLAQFFQVLIHVHSCHP